MIHLINGMKLSVSNKPISNSFFDSDIKFKIMSLGAQRPDLTRVRYGLGSFRKAGWNKNPQEKIRQINNYICLRQNGTSYKSIQNSWFSAKFCSKIVLNLVFSSINILFCIPGFGGAYPSRGGSEDDGGGRHVWAHPSRADGGAEIRKVCRGAWPWAWGEAQNGGLINN